MELPVLNTQPPEKRDATKGSLDVVAVFDTFQGEGPLAGTPAVFVRLAGCNLQCPQCDTDYTTNRRRVRIPDLLQEVALFTQPTRAAPLVVVTGGEPFRQAALEEFVRELLYAGFRVQIETNGTLEPEGFPWYNSDLSVVVSPKTPTVRPAIWRHACAVKYVVKAGAVLESGIPTDVLGSVYPHGAASFKKDAAFTGDVYVQPADEKDEAKNKANLEEAMVVCRTYGYRLSIQQHKLLGVE